MSMATRKGLGRPGMIVTIHAFEGPDNVQNTFVH